MKTLKITTNNRLTLVDIQEPKMKGIKNEIDGYAEIVRPVGLYNLFTNIPGQENICMVVNEDGLRLELDLNHVATVLYNFCNDSFHPIVGDILILGLEFIDGVYELVGLNDEQEYALREELLDNFKFLKIECLSR